MTTTFQEIFDSPETISQLTDAQVWALACTGSFKTVDCPVDDCQDTFPSADALAEHVDFDHCETCGFGTKDPSGRHHTAWCPEGV